MQRKIEEYFLAGVRLVWIIDPKTQSATVYTSPSKASRIGSEQSLEGGDVLPGLRIPLKPLFARARQRRRNSR
jgi:Uma2 family endonuclease